MLFGADVKTSQYHKYWIKILFAIYIQEIKTTLFDIFGWVGFSTYFNVTGPFIVAKCITESHKYQTKVSSDDELLHISDPPLPV